MAHLEASCDSHLVDESRPFPGGGAGKAVRRTAVTTRTCAEAGENNGDAAPHGDTGLEHGERAHPDHRKLLPRRPGNDVCTRVQDGVIATTVAHLDAGKRTFGHLCTLARAARRRNLG